MLGCNIEPSSLMVGDNMAVVLNTTIPSSSLKKKHQACNYHKVRESIAGGFIRFAHIKSEDNLADILTKPLPRVLFERLTSKCLFRKASTITAQVNMIVQARMGRPISPPPAKNQIRSILIDSGASGSLINPVDFYIESYENGQVGTVQGFLHEIRNLRIGNGITAVELKDKTILLRVNDALIVESTSIISVNQLRHSGIQVDDIPRKYRGRQEMYIDDMIIPLVYIKGLIWLPTRFPTRKELNECKIYDITTKKEWDVMEECDSYDEYYAY
ncbi:MAG TPA: hypothetical protein VIL14_01800 [Nitrososphaeraceae archaeon]